METPPSGEGGSADSAKWELGWQAPDNMLKIAVFENKERSTRRKGASDQIRERISRMEASMALGNRRRHRFRSSNKKSSSGKLLDSFRSLVRSVVLLLRCFRMRKKIAVQSGDLTFTHQERMVDLTIHARSSLSLEMRMVLDMPPRLRKMEDLRKVASYLRANGAVRAMMGHTSSTDDENLARYVSYERYENGRVIAQQGRSPDRFYYVMSGKILVVNEYHVGNSVISKTVSVLTKGCTTSSDEIEKESERQQTLVCRGSVEAIVLDKDDYFTLRRERSGGAKEYLATHRFFRLFPSHLLHNDGNLLQMQYYPNGSVVFSGGKQYEWIYIIKSGECALVRTQLVNNVICQKKTLFNKQTPQELGCDKSFRLKNVNGPMADFRVWRKQADQPLWKRKSPNSARSRFANKSVAWEDRSFPGNEDSVSNGNDYKDSESIKSISFPPLSFSEDRSIPDVIAEEDRDIGYSGLSPIDAAMAGIDRRPKQVLSRSRMTASSSRVSMDEHPLVHEKNGVRSAPPTLRRAHLELGKLRSGDVFGLDDLYGGADDVTRIALLSNGADVVMLKRGFFLRHAPANLLIQLSGLNHDFPTIGEARASLEATETWTLYKNALIKLLTSGRNTSKQPVTSQRAVSAGNARNNRLHGRRSRFISRSMTAHGGKSEYFNYDSPSTRIRTYASNGVKYANRNISSAPVTRPNNPTRRFEPRPRIIAFKV